MRLLNATLPLVVMSTVGSARADSFAEVMAGVSIPVADSSWTDTAESSPQIGARAGAINPRGLGGMVQFDWTPVSLDTSSFGTADFAFHRFRLLADLVIQRHVAPKLVVSGRVGIGLDIAHGSSHESITNNNSSDTDLGFAFELGGGLWYDMGDIQLGGELALPVGAHSKKGNGADGNYQFDYTSWDINLVFGVRLFSR
jgi:Outer membrane protein beta-barrel domain